MDQTINTTLNTILYVGFGFLLSWGFNWLGDRYKKKEIAHSVRRMIRIEIDQNLELLRQFWALIQQGKTEKHRAVKFTNLTFPVWQKLAIESQMSALPTAFKETEIVEIFQRYQGFGRLEHLHRSFQAARESQKADERTYDPDNPMHQYLISQQFAVKVDQEWAECERLITEMLSKGNPVGD
jgi:hypothetical protein